MSQVNEYVHVFAKKSEDITLAPLDSGEEPESDWEKDDKGYYKEGYPLLRTGTGARREDRPEMYFPIYIGSDNSISTERLSEDDVVVLPRRPDGTDARWMWGREKVTEHSEDLLVKRLQNGSVSIITKVRPNLGDRFTRKPRSLWYKPEYAASNGTNMIRKIFDGQRIFDFPKSVPFISDLLRFANVGHDGIVLDSFAGSGTTAHAVLSLNKEDGGNRQFILVECEDYADRITAERVRRVIKGVPSAKDKALREGVGGSFTYCELGEPISIEGMLSGEALPSYESLASYLLYTATGVTAERALHPQNEDGLFYHHDETGYYLLYQPDQEYLRGKDARLNLERAERIHETERKAVVFGIDKFIGQRKLTTMGITFCQLPYCISSSLT